MSDEEINIAIAEACGWKDIWVECAAVGIPPEIKSRARMDSKHIPNYCHDLNAMALAEEIIFNKKEWIKYTDWLVDEIMSKKESPIRATARQRAEAFLRTKGLWVEGKS